MEAPSVAAPSFLTPRSSLLGGDTPPPAVILAAGFGSRLAPIAPGVHKSLVPLLGRPLLSYTLEGLARAGVEEAWIVIGHQGDQVRRSLDGMERFGIEVGVVVNPHFALPNGSSLAAARDVVAGRPFLLAMADHLLSAEAIARMLAAPGGFAVGVDRGPLPVERLADATKVRSEAGVVRAFGKRLHKWDGVDAGIFRCLPEVFGVIDALGLDRELSAIMTAVAERQPFHAVDLTGAFWLDVDTPADLADAEEILRRA